MCIEQWFWELFVFVFRKVQHKMSQTPPVVLIHNVTCNSMAHVVFKLCCVVLGGFGMLCMCVINWVIGVCSDKKSVINYSPSHHLKPVRLSFIFGTKIKIFLMKSESILPSHWQSMQLPAFQGLTTVKTSLK